MNRPIKNEILDDLDSQLVGAESLSARAMAREIQRIGFKCEGCGDCCRGEENCVALFPFEIRAIVAETGEGWLEAAGPPEEGEWDCEGSFHTLEWRLAKAGRDCKYYSEGRCRIYGARPLLCQTYPFTWRRGASNGLNAGGSGARSATRRPRSSPSF